MKFKFSDVVDRCKARLVVKGQKQKRKIHYFEVFTLVAKFDTVRMVISLVAQNNYRIYQIDFKSTFLNGVLNKEIYVEQPVGFVRRGQ